jgi:L-iditol 2-dehydrogenase
MKAMILEKKGLMTVKAVDDPKPFGEKPVLLRIVATGVCGSDITRYSQGKTYYFPIILGHEFSAIVEEVPANCRFSKGDRVAVYPLLPDYDDPFSKIGEYNVSSDYGYFGSRRNGAFSEYLYVPEANLVRIPEQIPWLHAAMAEPAAVALHGILKFKPVADSTALVIGGGPIGALAAQWLRILGCSNIYISEIDRRKRDILNKLGFETIDASRLDTVSVIMELSEGRGVNYSVEACGIPLTFIQAIESVGIFGQVLFLGNVNGEVSLKSSHIESILRHELKLYGSWNSKIMPVNNNEWRMVFNHMGKDLQVGPLITHTPSLDEGPGFFHKMAAKEIWFNKVVFRISEEAGGKVMAEDDTMSKNNAMSENDTMAGENL